MRRNLFKVEYFTTSLFADGFSPANLPHNNIIAFPKYLNTLSSDYQIYFESIDRFIADPDFSENSLWGTDLICSCEEMTLSLPETGVVVDIRTFRIPVQTDFPNIVRIISEA